MESKVTQAAVDDFLDSCEVQEHIFWDKELVVSYKQLNGFTISGRAACVHPDNFDIEIGRKVAREDAAKTVWLLLGYQLQQELFNTGAL